MMPARVSGWIFIVCAWQLALAPISRAEQPPTGRHATYDFDIPAQSVRSAIHEFEVTTGVGVTYWELSANRSEDSSFQVSGNFTADEALRILLGPSLVDDVVWVGGRLHVARKILSRADYHLAGRYATYHFQLLGGPVEQAFDDFEALTGISISWLTQRLDTHADWASAVSGEYTADQALRILLEPSGIDYEWIDDRTVYAGLLTRRVLDQLRATDAYVFDGMERVANTNRSYLFRIARVPIVDVVEPLKYYLGIDIHTEPAVESELRGSVNPLRGDWTAEPALEQLFAKPSVILEWTSPFDLLIRKRRWTDPPYSPWQERGITSDVQVEASRLFWFAPEQQPATVVARKEIERLGVSSVAQLIDYIAQQPFSRSEGVRVDGAQTVELRGLGADTTLVLIDGHRVRAAANSFESSAFDLNTIPVVAVERVEVYLDSTPFSVGADAIGGVVNIVMKTGASRPKIDLHYGTADGGAQERRVSFTTGLSRESFRATGVLDYFDRANLLGSERDRWRNQDYRRFGGRDFRSPDANPGNVSSLTLNNLPGLPARFAAVPTSHDDVLTASDFLATAGQRNLTSLLSYQSILPETERGGAFLTFDWRLAAVFDVYGQMLFARRKNTLSSSPASVSNAVVPANNPHNPFGVPVRVNFQMLGIERERTTTQDYIHALLGARGEIGQWSWDVSVLRTEHEFLHLIRGELDRRRVLSSLAEPNEERSLNVFDNGPGGTASLLSSLTAPVVPIHFGSKTTDATAQIRGELFAWYAGKSTGSLGAQSSDFDQSIATVHMDTQRRRVQSMFAQWSVPLVAGERSEPALAMAAQGRIDRISDLRSIANSLLTLDWLPYVGVSLRATYGTTYRVPTLYQLHQPIVAVTAPIADPKREGAVANVTVLAGGNPQLELATAESWSVGFSFKSQGPGRLHVSGTYWETSVEGRVSTVNASVAFNREDLFRDRLVRAQPDAADIALGQPGPIISLNVSPGAGGTLQASGFDIQASMDINTRLGRIVPELSATWMREFRTTDWPGLPEMERVSIASDPGSIPRWRAVAGITWGLGVFELSTHARFISPYADVDFVEDRKAGRDVPAYWLVDAQASLLFGRASEHDPSWRGVSISAGVNNLFDREPPFAQFGAEFGYDVAHGDLRGRFAYLRIAKEF